MRWRIIVVILALLPCALPPHTAFAQGEGEGQTSGDQAEPATDAAAAAEAPPGATTPAARRTPRALVTNFTRAYWAWKASSGNEAQVRHLLSFLPAEQRNALDNAGVRDAARLAEVLIELDADPDAGRIWKELIPESPDAPSLADGLPVSIPIYARRVTVRLYFQRDQADLGWRFAPETIDAAAEAHQQLFPDQYRLKALFESLGFGGLTRSTTLGMAHYKWISLFVLLLAAVVLDVIVRGIVRLIARRYLKREEDASAGGDTSRLIIKSARPFGLVAGALLVYFLLPLIDMPAVPEGILRAAARIVGMIAGLLAVFRVVDLAGEWFSRRAGRTATKVDDLLIPLIRKAVKLFLLAFGLVFIADALNLPIASLVAGFSIAGAAIAFASKDTIENLFGSVAVILDRPFVVGDWVVVGDVEGTVEELGFRSTRIRTFYNSLVTVPNATLVRAQVDNYGRRRYRRFKTYLNLDYATPPDRIEEFCEGIRELIRARPDTRKDMFEIHLNAFGPHSIDVLVYMFFRVPDWSVELRARHAFMLDIIRLARRLGIGFAFPTQTLHVIQDEGGLPEPRPGAVERAPAPDAQQAGKAAAGDVIANAEWRKAAQ